MLIFFLYTVFESSFFPSGIPYEKKFNPASCINEPTNFTAFIEQRFGLEDLRKANFYFHTKLYRLNFSSFGNSLYRENLIGIGFAFPASKYLDTGFDISVLNYWIKDYANEFSYSLKAGALVHYPPVEIGGWANNLNTPRFSQIDYLPFIYSIGINWQGAENLNFLFFLRGIETKLPFLNLGIFYSPYHTIKLGLGVNTEPLSAGFSSEIHLGDFVFTYLGNAHQCLGLSHSLGMSFML